MPAELISVLGALLGVLVGGAINYAVTRSVNTRDWRLALVRDQARMRQRLYAEFLAEAQRTVIQGREDKISALSDFNKLRTKFAEIRLVAPPALIKASNALNDYAIASQPAQRAKEAAEFTVLTDRFILAARNDIDAALKNI